METDSKLINQGSYGCIYYPSLPFQVKRNKKQNSHKTPWDALKSTHELRSKYVSKLQKFNFHSDFEDHIGRKIQEIPSYELFFVPVLKTYKIDLATIKEKHVTGCDAISKYIRRNVRKNNRENNDDNDNDNDNDQTQTHDDNDNNNDQTQTRNRKLTTNDYKILNKNFIIQKMKYINGIYLHRYLLDVVKYSETAASSVSTDASERYKIFSSGSDASSASSSEASDDNYSDELGSKAQLTKTLRKDEQQIAKYRSKFKKEENNTSSYHLLSILFDLYERITDSVQVLIKYKIVHYDLKENNILVEKRHQLPYIIDFGLSIDISRLQEHPCS